MDMTMLTLAILLTVFGLVILLSASEYNGRVRFHDSAYYFKKQLFATSLGLGAMYIISTMNYRFFVRLAPAAYLLSLLLSSKRANQWGGYRYRQFRSTYRWKTL